MKYDIYGPVSIHVHILPVVKMLFLYILHFSGYLVLVTFHLYVVDCTVYVDLLDLVCLVYHAHVVAIMCSGVVWL